MNQLHQESSSNVDSICRTCLDNLSNIRHDIFHTPDLKKKLKECTFIEDEPHDGLPKNICASCCLKINDFYEFQEMCTYATKHCYALLNDSKERCTVEFGIDEKKQPSTTLLNEAKEEPEEQHIFEKFNEVQDYDFSSAKEISELEPLISKKEESDSDSNYEDGEFEINYSENDAIDSESQTRKKKCRKTDYSVPKHKSLICEICNKRFHKEMLLAAHKRTHEGLKPFPCDQCDKQFSKQCRLKAHVRVVHERVGGERFICPVEGCGRTYALRDTLRTHTREVHSGKRERPSYICEDCGKVLTSLSTLKNHRYQHTDQQRPHECFLCKKRYITSHKLKEHLNRHAGIRNYICPHCGARKTTRTELNTHINYHTKEKTYPCKFCDLVFNSIGNFGRHVRTVHEGIKNFKCNYCEKSFGKAETRKHHEMTHTGEKPHECQICHKKFIQSVSLHKHMKMHSKAAARAEQSSNSLQL